MQTSTLQLEESPKGQVLIPLIRAAATIGFTIRALCTPTSRNP
jgi:hypothetical protein